MNVFASDFASLADLAAYQHAKSLGWSDARAFAVGDNGLGCWGDFTATESVAMCALPPEEWLKEWSSSEKARGAKVAVTYNGKTVICELRDTMPHYNHITNGCGIDLNPGALKAFGLKDPIKLQMAWEWADEEPPPDKSGWFANLLSGIAEVI